MSIHVTLELKNTTAGTTTVRIPAGTVFEVAVPNLGVQNVVVTQSQSYTLPPGARRIVKIPGNCLNARPGRLTPFRFTGNSTHQDSVWQTVENTSAHRP